MRICFSEKCRVSLEERWLSDAAALEEDILSRLATIDLDALPPLKARRLSNPELWTHDTGCVGDAAACAATKAGDRLTALERIAVELEEFE